MPLLQLFGVFLWALLLLALPCHAQNNVLKWEFRLAGAASALSGRVEMRPNNTAPWGTICVDMFKESNYGPIAACNSAGLIGVTQAVFSSAYGAGDTNSPIYLTNVYCQPGQQFIQNCSTSQLQQVGNCVHWEDVGVDCSPPTNMWQFGLINGTAPSNGILAIKPMPALAWGSVYYWYFIVNDQVKYLELACADVGYNLSLTKDKRAMTRPARHVFNRINYYPTVANFFPYYYGTGCPSNAKNIRECGYYQMGSQSWDPSVYSIYVDCRPPQAAPIPTIEVRFTNPWPGWRSGVGNIEVRRPLENPAWGNICPEAITTYAYNTPSWSAPTPEHLANMKAICASGGYPGAVNPQFRRYGASAYIYNSSMAVGYYEYIADKMNCTGATTLAECEIYAPLGHYYCGWNLYYAGIDCYSLPENRSEWEYRLWAGTNGRGNGVTSGVFQMRPNRTSPWASIVQQTTAIVWDTICRSFGNSINSTSYAQGKPFGIRREALYYGYSGNSSYWIESVSCSSADNTLFKDCNLSPLGSFQSGYQGNDMALDCNPPPFDPSKWEFRLVGANASQGTGMLEFKPQPYLDWGYIIEPYGIPQSSASYTWFPYNALAICHSLGYMNVEAPTIQIYRQYINNSAPMYFQYMRCVATNTFVQNCTFNYRLFDTVGQSNYWAMGVECYPFIFRPLWRLTGGDAPWRGRIEYKYLEGGAWGTICNDYFKNNYIAWNAACHSAGYLNVTGARYRSYGPGTGSILYDDIQCKSGDFYIENCTKLPITQHNCFHGQDAGVDCYPPADRIDLWEFRLQDGTAATNGRLEMRPTSAATWGTVCSDPFNHSHYAWLAACRQTGFPNVQRAAWRYFGKGPETIYLDNVQCFANSTTLMNCTTDPIDSFFCTPWDAAGVDCDPPPETPELWQFRLTGGRTASNGRLEMRPTATGIWGNVCRNGLSNSRIALLAICKTVGFNAVRPVARFFGKGKGTIYLDNATCAPGTNILNQCSFNPLYSHACTHDMDMGIECFPSATAALTLTKTETFTKALKPTKSQVLTKTVTISVSSTASFTRPETLTKALAKKKRTVTQTPLSETKSSRLSPTISASKELHQTISHLKPVTLTQPLAKTVSKALQQTRTKSSFHVTKSADLTSTPVIVRNSPSSSQTKVETKTLAKPLTQSGAQPKSQSLEASVSHFDAKGDQTHTRNQTASIDIKQQGNGSVTNENPPTLSKEASKDPVVTISKELSKSVDPLKTHSRPMTISDAPAPTPTEDISQSLNLTKGMSMSKSIIPMPSCELNATSTIGSHIFFSPMGGSFLTWPMTTVDTGATLETSQFDIPLPDTFPLNSIANWSPAELWIYAIDGALERLGSTGINTAVTIRNNTMPPQLTVSISAKIEHQTFGNLFPPSYPDRSAIVVMNLTSATSCNVYNVKYLAIARVVFTNEGLVGGAPQPDGEPHVENDHLVVPDPTFLNAPAEAAAIVRGVLPCDVRVPDASIAYFRMLSPFAISADFFAVLLGTGVFLLFVLGMQVLSVLAARTFRVRRTLFGCAAACHAPAITIAVTQPLGLGVAFSSAALIAQSESHPENWIVGLAGCLIVAVLPFPIILFLYRCVSRRYVAYIGVAPDPFPAWLAPHIFPYGRQKPEMFSKALAPLINFRNVSPIWPIWTFLSPIGTMIIILVLGPMDALCKHVFLALAVLHFLLAAIFAVYRPRRSTFLSLWTVLQLLVSAIMFLASALAAYNPESTMLADLSYILCCIQTGFVGSRIALTPVCFWSDRVLSYKKVKAVAEHIAPDGERFELNPGDADYQRDDEDARMANLDDDRLSDLGEEPLLMDIPKDEEEHWTNLLQSPATKEVPDFSDDHVQSGSSDSANAHGNDNEGDEDDGWEAETSNEDSSDLSSEVEL